MLVPEHDRRLGDLHVQLHLAVLKDGRHCRCALLTLGPDINGRLGIVHPAGLHLADVEHVIDECCQPLSFADDDVDIALHQLGGLLGFGVVGGHMRNDAAGELAADDLGEAEHRRERGAQLMAGHRDELGLHAVHLLLQGHVTQHGHNPHAGTVLGPNDAGGNLSDSVIGQRQFPLYEAVLIVGPRRLERIDQVRRKGSSGSLSDDALLELVQVPEDRVHDLDGPSIGADDDQPVGQVLQNRLSLGQARAQSAGTLGNASLELGIEGDVAL